MLHLSKSYLRIVKGVLAKQIPEYEVRAFGSRVHGRALKMNSDLDLVIMSQRPLPGMRFAELKEAFSESDLPMKVDVLEWADCSKVFRDIISERSTLIQTGAPAKQPRKAA